MMRLFSGATMICLAASAAAGTFTNNFNAGSLPPGTVLYNAGAAPGPSVATTGGVGNSGVLKLTVAQNSQHGTFLITNRLDGLRSVSSFVVNFKLRLGNANPPGPQNAADGFSFNFADDLPNGSFANAEEGAGTGLTVSFDTYDNGGSEAPAIDVKFGGITVATTPMDPAVLFTEPNFVDVQIVLNADGTLNVSYAGNPIYSSLATGYTPMAGRFGFAGRTGGANENCFIDELGITTVPLPQPFVLSANPVGTGASPEAVVAIQLQDQGTLVNTNSIQLTFNGASVAPAISKVSGVTTIQYDPPGSLAFASSNSYRLIYSDDAATPASFTNTFNFFVTRTTTNAPNPDAWPSTSDSNKVVRFVFTDSAIAPLSANWTGNMLIAGNHDQQTVPVSVNGHVGAKIGNYLNTADPDYTFWDTQDTIDILMQVYGDAALLQNGVPRNYTFLLGGGPLSSQTGGTITSESQNACWNWVLFRVANPEPFAGAGFRFVGGTGSAPYGGVNDGTIRMDGQLNMIVRAVAFGERGAFGEPDQVNLFQPIIPTQVQSALPQGSIRPMPDAAVEIKLQDNTAQVNTNSIQLIFNGSAVTPAIVKSGGITTVFYDPPGSLALSSSNSYSVIHSDNSPKTYTNNYNFTVVAQAFTSIETPNSEAWPPKSDTNKIVHYVFTDAGLAPLSANWISNLVIQGDGDQATSPITLAGHTGVKVEVAHLNTGDPAYTIWNTNDTIDILMQVYGNPGMLGRPAVRPQAETQPRNFTFLLGGFPITGQPGGTIPIDSQNQKWNWVLFRVSNPEVSPGTRFVGGTGSPPHGGVNGGTIRMESVPGLIVRAIAFAQQGAFGEPAEINLFQPTPPTVIRSGNNITISWPFGGLKAANNVAGPYSEIINATSPLIESVSSNRLYSVRPVY